MKILITGGAGLVASTLFRKAPSKYTLHATIHENKMVADLSSVFYHPVDIRDKDAVDRMVDAIKPDTIIHTAAKGSPDFCDKYPKDAWDINVGGTLNMLEAAHKIGTRIFVLSSNQVFDGNSPPYDELSEPSPINVYGKTKKQNELDAKKFSNAVIIRPITMYGWANPRGQQNMANTVVKKLRNDEKMNVTQDMFNNYLYVGFMADTLWGLVDMKMPPKVIHVAGKDKASLSDFSILVARTFDLDTKLITPVPKSFFGDESARPLDTSYQTKLLQEVMQIKPITLQDGLIKMKKAEMLTTWKNL